MGRGDFTGHFLVGRGRENMYIMILDCPVTSVSYFSYQLAVNLFFIIFHFPYQFVYVSDTVN